MSSLAQRVPLVGQNLLTLQDRMSSPLFCGRFDVVLIVRLLISTFLFPNFDVQNNFHIKRYSVFTSIYVVSACFIRNRNCLFFVSTWIHPLLWVTHVYLVFCVVVFVLFVIVLCVVPNVACVSMLSSLDLSFGFHMRLFIDGYLHLLTNTDTKYEFHIR